LRLGYTTRFSLDRGSSLNPARDCSALTAWRSRSGAGTRPLEKTDGRRSRIQFAREQSWARDCSDCCCSRCRLPCPGARYVRVCLIAMAFNYSRDCRLFTLGLEDLLFPDILLRHFLRSFTCRAEPFSCQSPSPSELLLLRYGNYYFS